MNDYPELQVARGVRNGLLIAIPFWIVLLFCVSKVHAQEPQPVPLVSVSTIPSSERFQGEQKRAGQPRPVGTARHLSLPLNSYIAASAVDTGYSLYLFQAKHAREAGLGRGFEQQPGKFIATKATVLTGTVLVLRVMERKYPRLAKITTWGFVGLESAVIVRNYTVTR